MVQAFLSQQEVDALLKGVTSESDDDWAEAMNEQAIVESSVGDSTSLDKANYMIGYWTGVRDTLRKSK